MKIFNKEFKLPSFGVANAKEETAQPTRQAKKVFGKAVRMQLFRFQNQISLWKLGIEQFEDISYPTNENLIRVYNDAVLDSHLAAIMDARKSKTLSKDFKFVDEEGEEVTDTTKLFSTPWFHKTLDLALDSNFFGFTLLQFGDRIGNDFKTVEVVPREYVDPQREIVRTSPTRNILRMWYL